MDKLKGKLSGALTKPGQGKTGEILREAAKDEPAGQPPKTEPKFGLAVSRSSSLNLGGLNTEAYVVDGKVVLTGDSVFWASGPQTIARYWQLAELLPFPRPKTQLRV